MDKVVYVHRTQTDGRVFYVGIGSETRPYQMAKADRNKRWWEVFQTEGVEVEVINMNLTWKDAQYSEKELISTFGRECDGGQLVNILVGGNTQPSFKGGTHSTSFRKRRSEELLRDHHRSNKITIDGVEYRSIRSAARELNMNYSTVAQRLNSKSFNTWLRN